MAEFDERLAKATEIAAEQDSGGSPAAAISATAMATHMRWRHQMEERMAEKAMMRMRVKAQVKGFSLKKAVVGRTTMAATAAIPTMTKAVNATTAPAATIAASATVTRGAGRTSVKEAADAKRISKADPPPSPRHRQ